MADVVSYPQIDPTHFDLTVVGTGLPESIIAAAASAVGKSVLHLDPNCFYGGHFSSFSLDNFTHFLQLQQGNKDDLHLPSPLFSVGGGFDNIAVDLKTQCLYSDVEFSFHRSSEDLGPSRNFSLDLSGPKVFFCADSSLNLFLKSGARHYVGFQSVDSNFIYGDNKKLFIVPDSRSTIFSHESLSLPEKKRLSGFFNLVQEYLGSNETTKAQSKISDEDLETPFVDFLTKQQLTPNIKRIILYAIAMADYDQEMAEDCKNLIKTKDGIETLALYRSSVRRLKNALGELVPGAFIFPLYGQGELPQAFCRTAAVKGALYVLRMPVTTVFFDKDSGQYKGLRLASGQEVSSTHLVMGPSFAVPSKSVLSPILGPQQKVSERSTVSDVIGQVARAVCIASASIVPGKTNLLVVFPPRSLFPEQVMSVRVLQLGDNAAVCPPSLFVWYLSTLCYDAAKGKESLHAAINPLLTCSVSKSHKENDMVQNENEKPRITLLWSAMYIQQLTKVSSGSISVCPMPDGNLDYREILHSSEKLFRELYPNEEFIPETEELEDLRVKR